MLNNRHVVIIGAGATGVAAFIALVRYKAVGKITLIDPLGVAVGYVYSYDDQELLCNTSVDLMSVLPLECNDLLQYLHENGQREATATDFIPRKAVGHYIRKRYNDYVSLAKEYGIETTEIIAEVEGIEKEQPNVYTVKLNHHKTVSATDVIVCTGLGKPIIPHFIAQYSGAANIYKSPYLANPLSKKITNHQQVLVLGSKLSAIDTAIMLCRDEHQVTLTSPSGELPAVRNNLIRNVNYNAELSEIARIDFCANDAKRKIENFIQSFIEKTYQIPLAQQVSQTNEVQTRLQEEIDLAKKDQVHWQKVIIPIVDILNELAMGLDKRVKDDLIAPYHHLLSRYIGAMPLKNAEKLLHYFNNNNLKFKQCQISKIDKSNEGWQVTWSNGETSYFDAIVCATGNQYPSFQITSNALNFTVNRSNEASVPDINEKLMIKFQNGFDYEHIWLIGIAAHHKVPFVNALYIAVRHANEVAKQIAGR